MSTHRLSASGDRPFVLNAGGGSFQAFSLNAKAGDGMQVDIGSEELLVVLPSRGVKLERFQLSDGAIIQVLRIEGNENEIEGEKYRSSTQLTITGANDKSHPRSNVDVRKSQPVESKLVSMLGREAVEPVETIDLAIPPTE